MVLEIFGISFDRLPHCYAPATVHVRLRNACAGRHSTESMSEECQKKIRNSQMGHMNLLMFAGFCGCVHFPSGMGQEPVLGAPFRVRLVDIDLEQQKEWITGDVQLVRCSSRYPNWQVQEFHV